MSNPQTISPKIIKGSFIVLFLAFLGSFFAYLIRVILSHALSVEGYGLFYAIFGLFTILTTYIDLGLGYSIIYLLPKYIKLNNYSKAWNIFAYGQLIPFGVSLLISIILIIFAPFLSKNYFKIPGSELLIYIFCIYLISFTVIYSLTQAYGGMQKVKYYSSISFVRWFLTVIITLIFLTGGFSNIVYYAAAFSLAHILTAIIYLYLLFRNHKFISSNKIILDKVTIKEMFDFSMPALAEAIVYSLILFGDNFFLILFRGVKEVGVYNVIYPLSSIPIILINPLTTLILPLVSHMMEGERESLKNMLEKVLQIIPFAGLYFSLFIATFPSSVISLIFGQKWLSLAELPLTLLSMGAIAILMSVILGSITLGTGQVWRKLRVTFYASLINLIMNALFIWYLGVVGAVITTSLFALILCYLFIRIIKSSVPIRLPYTLYLKLSIFAVSFYFVVRQFNIEIQDWSKFIFIGILYSVIYLIFGYFLKLYDKSLLTKTLFNGSSV